MKTDYTLDSCDRDANQGQVFIGDLELFTREGESRASPESSRRSK